MEKLDIFTLDLLGKSFLEWGKSFENQVEIFTPAKSSKQGLEPKVMPKSKKKLRKIVAKV